LAKGSGWTGPTMILASAFSKSTMQEADRYKSEMINSLIIFLLIIYLNENPNKYLFLIISSFFVCYFYFRTFSLRTMSSHPEMLFINVNNYSPRAISPYRNYIYTNE